MPKTFSDDVKQWAAEVEAKRAPLEAVAKAMQQQIEQVRRYGSDLRR